MAKVFISSPRADSATFAGRIYDRLVARFGRKNVFKDVDDIPVGVRFADCIQESLGQCAGRAGAHRAGLAGARSETGGRRLVLSPL